MYQHKSKHIHYRRIVDQKRQWVDADDIKPEHFVLNHLLLDNGKIIRGWWSGQAWDGIRYSDKYKVIKWKKCSE